MSKGGFYEMDKIEEQKKLTEFHLDEQLQERWRYNLDYALDHPF